jgi:pyruvate dehydrogenase E1 component alpha subunit/2-oxoisovalerate dehydrogenase E1 component alpha subunit
VGVAYGAKIKKDPIVVMAYLGDGATSEGDFHVAANFAGVWKTPVVFVCQNNQWAISLPLSMQTASETIAMKAAAYGFTGVRVDGNDVLAVYKAAQQAVDRARTGGGPTLIEAVTYRIGAHSSSDDPSRYRSEEEVEKWRKRDPVDRYKNYLKQRHIWSQEFESQILEELNTKITQAINEAESAPTLTLDSLFEDVYAELPWHLREQLESLKRAQTRTA